MYNEHSSLRKRTRTTTYPGKTCFYISFQRNARVSFSISCLGTNVDETINVPSDALGIQTNGSARQSLHVQSASSPFLISLPPFPAL